MLQYAVVLSIVVGTLCKINNNKPLEQTASQQFQENIQQQSYDNAQYTGQSVQGGQNSGTGSSGQANTYPQFAGLYLQSDDQKQPPQQQGYDYQEYLKQYADRFIQDSQQDSDAAGPAGGNYNEIIQHYAGSHVQGGHRVGNADQQGGDYQKYYKQLSGQHMQKSFPPQESTTNTTHQESLDYEQYVKKNAAPYMNIGQRARKEGIQPGGDYQHYIRHYAGQYMHRGHIERIGNYPQHWQYVGPYHDAGHEGSQQGHQQYMMQYGGLQMRNDQGQATHIHDRSAAHSDDFLKPQQQYTMTQQPHLNSQQMEHSIAQANHAHSLGTHVAKDQHSRPHPAAQGVKPIAKNQLRTLRVSHSATTRLASLRLFISQRNSMLVGVLAAGVSTFVCLFFLVARKHHVPNEQDSCYVNIGS